MTVITEGEWSILKECYSYDREITILKLKKPNELCQKDATETSNTELMDYFIFEPDVCQQCIEQNELDKYLFENKKIYIRQIEDDSPPLVPPVTSTTNQIEAKQSTESLETGSCDQNNKEDDSEIMFLVIFGLI